jgi:hypothetical protein
VAWNVYADFFDRGVLGRTLGIGTLLLGLRLSGTNPNFANPPSERTQFADARQAVTVVAVPFVSMSICADTTNATNNIIESPTIKAPARMSIVTMLHPPRSARDAQATHAELLNYLFG